jgi:tetratricopeptide (TPR) repeat protein
LQHDGQHADALALLAAVRWLEGDLHNLAAQATRMDQEQVAEPRFHFFAAVAHLAADDYPATLQACRRVFDRQPSHHGRNGDSAFDLGVESKYVAALAHIGLNDRLAAIEALQDVARAKASPSAAQAQALLGLVQFAEQRHEEALQSWQALDANARQERSLTEPLAHTMFLVALEDLVRANYEISADKFRQAGRLGCRDRRLGPLLLLALFKAGQQAIYAGESVGVSG